MESTLRDYGLLLEQSVDAGRVLTHNQLLLPKEWNHDDQKESNRS